MSEPVALHCLEDSTLCDGEWHDCRRCGGKVYVKNEFGVWSGCPECGGHGGWVCPRSFEAMELSELRETQ